MDSSKPIDTSEFEPSDPRADQGYLTLDELERIRKDTKRPKAIKPPRQTIKHQMANAAQHESNTARLRAGGDVPADWDAVIGRTLDERRAHLEVVGPQWREVLGVHATRPQVQIEPVQMDMSQPPIISDQEQRVG